MFLCLVYTVIVRNDCIRNAVDTKKKIIYRWIGSPIIFDITIFQKVFPLMISGALLLFAISFYSQTLLEISQTARKAVVALDEVSERYEDAVETREKIQESHDDRYLSKALLIAYMLEEDPSVLNEPADHEYSYLDEEGVRQYYSDEEGNRLRSVSFSPRLNMTVEAASWLNIRGGIGLNSKAPGLNYLYPDTSASGSGGTLAGDAAVE